MCHFAFEKIQTLVDKQTSNFFLRYIFTNAFDIEATSNKCSTVEEWENFITGSSLQMSTIVTEQWFSPIELKFSLV